VLLGALGSLHVRLSEVEAVAPGRQTTMVACFLAKRGESLKENEISRWNWSNLKERSFGNHELNQWV